MDLTPFVSTCRSIVKAWETKPPADLYRPLISALNEVLETPGGSASEKVRKERARITKHHEDSELAGTSGPYGRRVLNALGVEKVLGPGANDEIARVFAANQADPGAAAAGLEELLQATEGGAASPGTAEGRVRTILGAGRRQRPRRVGRPRDGDFRPYRIGPVRWGISRIPSRNGLRT